LAQGNAAITETPGELSPSTMHPKLLFVENGYSCECFAIGVGPFRG
jgi:hypothetical protein